MNQVYRKFKNEDVDALIELMRQLSYEHTQESLIRNIESVRNSGGEIFVCEVSGKVCGCISAILDARLAEGVNGEIVSVVVNESYRGTGMGKGLVATAEAWLKAYVSNITIRANTIRKEAHLFYQGLGYSLTKTQAILKKNI